MKKKKNLNRRDAIKTITFATPALAMQEFQTLKKISNIPLKGNIKWNFGKILVGKDGKPIDRFGSMTSPSSKKLIKAIEEALQG